MAAIKWGTPGSFTTVIDTALNSLATAALSALGAEFDNTSNLYLFARAQLDVTFGTGPTDNNQVDLYMYQSLDGTNYPESDERRQANYVGSFFLDNVTSAQVCQLWTPSLDGQIVLPPTKVKFALYNASGQTMAASGNTVKILPYAYQSA